MSGDRIIAILYLTVVGTATLGWLYAIFVFLKWLFF